MTTTKVSDAGWQFLAVLGSVFALVNEGEDKVLAGMLWRELPLAKALVELALKHPEEMQALWDKHLKDTMPFGEPPVTPTDDGWRLKTYAKAQDAPTAQLQRACDQLHDGESYFTNVMALGTYDALNMSTGEQRIQVGVAAKINREDAKAVAELARRLREVVADLEAVAVTTGQRES